MRLNFTLVLLLATASTAISVVWQSYAPAREGGVVAGVALLSGVLIGLVAGVLLGRIVVKVSAARRAGNES